MGLLRRLKRYLGCSEIAKSRLYSFSKRVGSASRIEQGSECGESLAIVVPCYRHDSFLEKTFASILNQTSKPDQVVFVNDCSPDRTGEILEELMRNHNNAGCSEYTIITNPVNLGQSRSLNKAIGEVRTHLVMVLNDDDYLMHDAVEVMRGLFKINRDLYLIGARSIHFGSDKELMLGEKLISHMLPASGCIPLDRRYPADVEGYKKSIDLNMTHSSSCFLKVAWEVVGGYYPDRRQRVVLSADRDFQLRINSLFPVAISQEIPFAYWRSNSSVDNGLFS